MINNITEYQKGTDEMAFHNHKNNKENSKNAGLGIGAHDFLKNTYSGTTLIKTEYFRGGKQAGGENVGVLEFTYDGNGNILTVERTS